MYSTRLTKVIFIFYLIFLTWVILLKMDITDIFYRIQSTSYRSVNLIPFAGTAVYNGHLDYLEIGLNVCIFLPYGLYLRAIHPKESRFHDFIQIVLTSLLFEMLQFVFSIGVADITDLLANSLGGLFGILLFQQLEKTGKNRLITWLNMWSLIGFVFLFLYLWIRR